MKKTKLENQQQVWKGCKKQPVRQQAWHIPKIWSAITISTIFIFIELFISQNITFKKMKPKNEAYNIPRIGRSGSSIKQKPTTEEQTYGFCGENITIQAYSHYNCFRKKKIILPEKQKGIHSEKSKQTIEADCRFSGEISDYLYTALKGWGIWVSNRLPGK